MWGNVLGKILLALRIYVIAVSPLLPGLFSLPPPSLGCFQPKSPLLSWSVPSDVQFSLRVYDWHGACLCPEMLGSSVMWWVYIFKNNPHSSDFEPNSNLKFFAVDDDDYMFCFFSVQQCTVMRTIIVGFHFYGYSFCVLHVVLKHFGVKYPPYPLQLKSSGPYLVILSL